MTIQEIKDLNEKANTKINCISTNELLGIYETLAIEYTQTYLFSNVLCECINEKYGPEVLTEIINDVNEHILLSEGIDTSIDISAEHEEMLKKMFDDRLD